MNDDDLELAGAVADGLATDEEQASESRPTPSCRRSRHRWARCRPRIRDVPPPAERTRAAALAAALAALRRGPDERVDRRRCRHRRTWCRSPRVAACAWSAPPAPPRRSPCWRSVAWWSSTARATTPPTRRLRRASTATTDAHASGADRRSLPPPRWRRWRRRLRRRAGGDAAPQTMEVAAATAVAARSSRGDAGWFRRPAARSRG